MSTAAVLRDLRRSTDAMVETRDVDLDTGIDKLMGVTGRVLQECVEGSARRIVDAVGAPDDDRTLLLVPPRG